MSPMLPVMGGGLAGLAVMQPLSPLHEKWKSSLDQKANDALTSVGPAVATDILQELERKGSAVRNPSAYICRACENRKMGIGPKLAGEISPWLERYRGTLDQEVLESLSRIDQQHALVLLQNIDSADGSIRNPSAYIAKSIKNLETGSNLPELRSAPMNGTDGKELDDKARAALAEVGPEAAKAIMAELEAKGDSVRNVSAYVCRAVGNTRRGEGAAGGLLPVPSVDVPTSKDGDGQVLAPGNDVLGAWRSKLDADAVRTLETVGATAASAILSELDSRGDQVRNPSAYVVKAAVNMMHGNVPPNLQAALSGVAAKGSSADNAVAQAELDLQMSKYRHLIDEKATKALSELSAGIAAAILAQLGKLGGGVKNPSAYICKAVGNAQNGLNISQQNEAKRMRLA
eukprot:gnl/TRDRNA2_/TRDRNA2_80852_c0_seq1.p1 gnl/TRDRNA2_/TRDRNA2_80852_c0~~gnl/TRDRNA2_/TRDRNA2_80852_c0_seq1.p1  ORF type:complete len:402 (+),score=86.20 gnl/TRDRNA2_/TRDRNA2_80852_c0_seq1:2-1207(+)